MRHRTNVGRTLEHIALLLLVITALASGARADQSTCAIDGADAPAVASARETVHGACSCDGAASSSAYRRCVHDQLAAIGSALSKACERAVLRIETRSTCGKPDSEVCCQTNRFGLTKPKRVRSGRCTAPRGGSSCTSTFDFLDDACTIDGCVPPPDSLCGNFTLDPGEECDPPNSAQCSATCTLCLPDGCIADSGACGNGSVDQGELCDPPNGTTCSNKCTSCAAASGDEILIGCTPGDTEVDASAVASTFLVAYTDTTPGNGQHAVAKRLGADGSVVDASPLAVSGLLPNTDGLGGFVFAATSNDQEFYVGWTTQSPSYPMNYFGGRRVPASGPITAGPDLIAQNLLFGFCHTSMVGPLNLAPTLAGDAFRSTWSVLYGCGADTYFATLAGVGNFFTVPPPGNTSSGPAPIVRGASDVAAVWWNGFVSSLSPPQIDQFLAASFVEPGTPSMIQLSHGFSEFEPALAAVGDTFVAVWTSAGEVRATRFTRADGALDPDGGLLVGTGTGTIREVAAASDGSNVIAVWSEDTGPGERTIRARHIAPDGSLVEPSPLTVATSTADATISVAATPAGTLVAYSRYEGPGHSVRAVLVGH